jgi:hypothetical protein
MKVILQAFNGKLRSDVMDIPEKSMPIWDMVLIKPVTAITGWSGEVLGERSELNTRCRFEWTGKYQDGARLYEMIDIDKL